MNLKEEFRVGLRYTLIGRHDRFVSFVSLLSAAGITLGVAALIVVLSVMNGFHQELRGRILSIASHLEVVSTDNKGLKNWESLAKQYEAHPEVLASAPQTQTQAFLINGERSQGVLVRGILPDEEKKVSQLFSYMKAGEIALHPGGYNLLMGDNLASQLGITVGEDVILIAPQGKLIATGFYPRLRRFKVVGLFSSGLYQFDSGLIYMHMEDAKTIYRIQGPTSLQLKTENVLNAPSVRQSLYGIAKGVRLYDWTSSNGGLFRALQLERRVMFVILTLIIAVAAFNIVSALMTMVRNKRGDIAILRAMGASSGAITRIFLFQGMIIGSVGTLAGVIIGIPVGIHAGSILERFEKLLGQDLFPGSVYHLEKLPSLVSISDSVSVAVVALVLSLLATIYPAWQGGRLNPADALRYE